MSIDRATIPGTRLREAGVFSSPSFVRRHAGNPVLTAEQVPYASTHTHNCGVIEHRGSYVMLFRNDARRSKSEPDVNDFSVGIADSDDGYAWTVRPEPAFVALDPRIVRVTDRYYINCADGEGASTWVTDDFKTFERVEKTLPGTRNQVIFPESIYGKYYRLERPMWQPNMPLVNRGDAPGGWIGPTWDIWISESPDLVYWGQPSLVLETGDLDYANAKIGAGAPPIRTPHGWLCIIHADDIDPRRGKNGWEATWFGRYHGGAMLLDLDNPRKVIAYSKRPLLTPEADYELSGGFRDNVVFPTATLLRDDGELIIYYGAADACVCIATAPIDDVVNFCFEP